MKRGASAVLIAMPHRMLRLALALALLAILPIAAHAAADTPAPAEFEAQLIKAWDAARPGLRQQLMAGLDQQNPNALYTLETYTHPLINAARDRGMRTQLSQLADLYGVAFSDKYLKQATDLRGRAYRGWLCGPACPAYAAGTPPSEVLLYSAQFLYGASALVNAISLVPAGERTDAMNRLMARAPYIAGTYQRWAYDSATGLHPDGLIKSTEALYMNGYRTDDATLQAAGGVVEMLGAAQHDAEQAGLDSTQMGELSSFAGTYWQLIGVRAKFDADGRMTYDENWAGIERNRCASYTKVDPPPTAAQCTGVKGRLSLDISHFARVPAVIESYDRTGSADGGAMLAGLAAQFADVVWNGDIGNPRFYNYFSGDEVRGWYDRSFDASGKVASKGYAPGALSSKGPAYFWLGRYSGRVRNIAAAYWRANPAKFRAAKPSDQRANLYALIAISNLLLGAE